MSDKTVEVYPLIERLDRGFRVRTGKQGYLPGIYLNELMATKALLRHVNSMKEARANKRKN